MDQKKIDDYNQQRQADVTKQGQQDNHNQVLQSLHDLLLATVVSKDPRLHDVAQNLGDFLQQIASATKDFQGSSLHLLPLANKELAATVSDLTSKVAELAPQDLTPHFKNLAQKLDNIQPPVINVPDSKIDLEPIISGLSDIKTALSETESMEFDTTGIIAAVQEVQTTLSNLRFPSTNYVLPFKDNVGKATQVKLDAAGNVPIAGTIAIDTTGLATSANQTTEITSLQLIDNLVLTEDTASATGDSGIQVLAVRASSPANTSGTNGDYEPLQVNAGRLWVSSVLEAGSNVIGHVITDTGSTTAVTGTVTVSGTVTTSPPSNASTNIAQINAVTPLMGNGATGTGSLRVTIASDNTAFSVNSTLSAETTKVIGVVRSADGAGNLLTSTGNALDVNIKTPTTLPVSIAGTVVVDDLAAASTGSAVPSNAQYQGNIAKTSLPAAGSDGNLTGNMSDKYGRSVVLNNAMRDIMGTQTTTITASTSETTIITQIASTFNDLVSVFISNTSATATRVDIRDTTGGSVIFQLYIPAGDMRGLSLTTPWPQTTVNTNWSAQSSTSVTDLRVSCLYIKNK